MTESEALGFINERINILKEVFPEDTEYNYKKALEISAKALKKQISELDDEIKLPYVSNEIIECKRKIAELEAKVYAYEKIIANSNFAPIISKEKGEL